MTHDTSAKLLAHQPVLYNKRTMSTGLSADLPPPPSKRKMIAPGPKPPLKPKEAGYFSPRSGRNKVDGSRKGSSGVATGSVSFSKAGNKAANKKGGDKVQLSTLPLFKGYKATDSTNKKGGVKSAEIDEEEFDITALGPPEPLPDAKTLNIEELDQVLKSAESSRSSTKNNVDRMHERLQDNSGKMGSLQSSYVSVLHELKELELLSSGKCGSILDFDVEGYEEIAGSGLSTLGIEGGDYASLDSMVADIKRGKAASETVTTAPPTDNFLQRMKEKSRRRQLAYTASNYGGVSVPDEEATVGVAPAQKRASKKAGVEGEAKKGKGSPRKKSVSSRRSSSSSNDDEVTVKGLLNLSRQRRVERRSQ